MRLEASGGNNRSELPLPLAGARRAKLALKARGGGAASEVDVAWQAVSPTRRALSSASTSPASGRGELDPPTERFNQKPWMLRLAAAWLAGSLSNEHRALTGFDRLRAVRKSARSLPWPIPFVSLSSRHIFRCWPDRQPVDIFRVFAFASHTPVQSVVQHRVAAAVDEIVLLSHRCR